MKILKRRPLHEGVDWNLFFCVDFKGRFVALFTRAWIEINDKKLKELKRYVALFTRAWIEISTVMKTEW